MHLMEPPSMDRGGKTGKLCFILFFDRCWCHLLVSGPLGGERPGMTRAIMPGDDSAGGGRTSG